ncbi:MAG: GGDEF domain-containing protein [Microthrixaceae bacterium]
MAPRATRRLLVAIEVIRGRTVRELVGGSILGLAAIGLADWLTGPNLNLGLGYAVVTLFAAFSISLRFGCSLAVLAALWSWAVATWHPDAFLPPPTNALNSALRVLFFLLLATVAAASRSVVDELDRLAGTDPLTGLRNRRALVTSLDREIAAAQRTGRPLTVAYLDLRNLKRVNDQLGHEAGDDLIRALARALAGDLRRADVVARVGGDEFVVLLPGVDAPTATMLLRRVLDGPGVPEANAGMVEYEFAAPDPAPDPDEMLRRADEAMYRAKSNGLPFHVETGDRLDAALRSGLPEPTRG